MRSGPIATSSAAEEMILARSPPPKRKSRRILFPSIQPAFRISSLNGRSDSTATGSSALDASPTSTPTCGMRSVCWARAIAGRAAAIPSPVTKSRRFIAPPWFCRPPIAPNPATGLNILRAQGTGVSDPDLADIDPLGADELRHPLWRDFDRAVGRARGRHHDVERLHRHVAIDRERRFQPERADAADLVAGDVGDFLEGEHLGLAAE